MKNIFIIAIAAMMLVGMASATITTLTPVTLDTPNDFCRMTGAWTAILGNGSYINFAMPGGYSYFLLVNVTSFDVSDPTVDVINIMAGDNPPAFRAGIGNLTVTMDDIGVAGTEIIGPLESARFMNDTGYCNVGTYMVSGTYTVLKLRTI